MSLLRSVLKKSAAPTNPTDANGSQPFNPLAGKGSAKSSRSSAQSFKSVASTIKSISSFYSVLTGNGPKVAKRRRPPILTFGAPEFYHSDPPPAVTVTGTERVPIESTSKLPFTSAHATSLLENNSTTNASQDAQDGDTEPWLSIVLFSHARPVDSQPKYHDQACVSGEIRMILSKPRNIESLNVWLVGKMENVLEMLGPPLVQQRARLWSSGSSVGRASKKNFAAGTHIFPFSFSPLPQDVGITQPEEAQRKNKGEVRLDLPPSFSVSAVGNFGGEVHYTVGVNVVYGNLWDIDDSLDMKIAYLPRTRPIPRELTPFPLLPTREDWPFDQEIVGGWMLLPFGGRGRFGDDMIEVEGIMGIPYPPVFHARDSVPFKLILWSESVSQLQQLAQPKNIQAAFVRNDVYGPDALVPRSGARRNRRALLMANGKIWREGEEVSEVDIDAGAKTVSTRTEFSAPMTLGSISEEAEDDDSEAASTDETSASTLPAAIWERASTPATLAVPAPPSAPQVKKPVTNSRWTSFIVETNDDDEEEEEGNSSTEADRSLDAPSESSTSSTVVVNEDGERTLKDGEDTVGGIALPPSPPSTVSDHEDHHDHELEEEDMASYFPGMEDAEKMITLSGTIPLATAAGRPSFNYKYMSRHYMAKIIITHPDYNHITPSATGIYAEAPIWITTDPPRTSESDPITDTTTPASSSQQLTPESTPQEATDPPRVKKSSELPILGAVVPLPAHDPTGATSDGAIWYPPVKGVHSDKARPTWKAQRLAAF